jgi:hypothetical protein
MKTIASGRRPVQASLALAVLLGLACDGAPAPQSAPPPSTSAQAVEAALVINILSPAEGAILNSPFGSSIVATVSPPDQVARVEFWDGTMPLFVTPFQPYSAPVAFTPGPHTVRIVAFDRAGNQVQATRSYLMDQVAPIAILGRAGFDPNPIAIGSVPLLISAFDAHSGVARFELYDGDLLVTSGTTVPPPPFSWNTTLAAAGPHTLKNMVWDRAGNVGVATLNLTVVHDTSPPMVAITSPAAGTALKGQVSVVAAVSDDFGVDRLELYDGDTLVWTVCCGPIGASPFTLPWDSGLAATGAHTLTVRAYDSSHNLATAAVAIIVDRAPPTLALTLTPGGPAPVSGVVSIAAAVSDDDVVTEVTFLEGPTVLGAVTSPPFTIAWNTATAADGPHTITARARDRAGNTSEASVSALVDNHIAAVTLTSPTDGALVGNTVTCKATTSNDGAVASLTFLDGTTSIGTVTTPPFEVTWLPTLGGGHSLTVQAADRQGRVTTSAAVTVTVDANAPVVAWLAPLNGGVAVDGPMLLAARASDDQGVAKVEFYDGETLIGSDLAPPYTLAWKTTGVARGVHLLIARASDGAGNVTSSQPVRVTLLDTPDTTAPSVVITAPAAGVDVTASSTVTITADASDANGASGVGFFVGGVLTCLDQQEPFACAWTVPAGKNRRYALEARALDGSGNVGTSARVTVTAR